MISRSVLDPSAVCGARPARGRAAAALLAVCAIVAATPPVAGGEGAAAAARPVLTAVEEGPGPDAYTLVCPGDVEHRLVRDGERSLLAVELPGVLSTVEPWSLPAPRGLVNAIAIAADGDQLTRIVFSLNRPALAEMVRSSRGLEVRLSPAETQAEGGPREAPPAAAASAQPPRAIGSGGSPVLTAPAAAGPPPDGPARPPAVTPRGSESGPDLAARAGSALAGVADAIPDRPLGTEDLLEISVFEIPDLNRTVRVSEKGTISLPLLGEVKADGLTPGELEVRLRDRLAEKYLKDPQVSVFVREHGSKKVSVLGAVGKPGVYEMLGPRTLLQVLALAGGLTEDTGAALFVIRQRPGGGSDKIPVNVNDLMVSRDPDLNLPIQPGDVVSAPLDRPVYIYVDGAVKTPGRIEQLASRPITLLQAIAKAGGATERANLRAIQILRQSPDGTQTMLEINLKRIRHGKEPDPVLGEGDVVVVPETFF